MIQINWVSLTQTKTQQSKEITDTVCLTSLNFPSHPRKFLALFFTFTTFKIWQYWYRRVDLIFKNFERSVSLSTVMIKLLFDKIECLGRMRSIDIYLVLKFTHHLKIFLLVIKNYVFLFLIQVCYPIGRYYWSIYT